MSWEALPDDVVDVILAKVCPIELARITTTCSSVRAAYCRRMAREQEARRQLAVSTFGAERISCFLDLILRLHKGVPLPPGGINGAGNRYQIRICADGVVRDPASSSPDTFAGGDMRMHLWREADTGWSLICLEAHHGRESMQVQIFPQGVDIQVFPTNDEDLVPVALAQALLSEGLIQFIRADGLYAMIHIGEDDQVHPMIDTDFTQAGLKAQIAPLLPFASQYITNETVVVVVKERMLIGQLPPF